MNLFFATDFTDFHRFFYSNPRKSVKFVAEVLVFPLKTVEPKISMSSVFSVAEALFHTFEKHSIGKRIYCAFALSINS